MKIRIQNFQAFSDVELDATGLTVIVGPSNHGKSSLIRAVTAALFNRPGEDFVRLGQHVAKVTLTDLPSWNKAFLNVEWSKGHNTNKFVVDGDEYSKVGLTAPAVLFDAGYRDVWIGDRERSKGEYIRPQVAGQFDRIFLLDRLGSFISDVLSVISRLAVLLRAHQRSVSDLKSQKQLLGVRTKDLTAAQERLTGLAPIVDLHARVSAITATTEGLASAQLDLDQKIRPLGVKRQAMWLVAGRTLPAATPVPANLGAETMRVRLLVHARSALTQLAGTTLPLPNAAGPIFEKAARRDVLAALMHSRRQYAALGAHVLPEAKRYPVQKLDKIMDTRKQMTRLVQEREAASKLHFTAKTTANAARGEEEQARAELGACMAELKTCPVCERPMAEAAGG